MRQDLSVMALYKFCMYVIFIETRFFLFDSIELNKIKLTSLTLVIFTTLFTTHTTIHNIKEDPENDVIAFMKEQSLEVCSNSE